ncbi:MAG: LysR substrate-binding domain-containing protein [Pseudomonadota bacterium]
MRIGAPEGLGRYVIADAAAELAVANPELEVQLTAAPRIMNLADREVDVAISVSRPTTGRLKVRKIIDYGLHLYGHKDYLARVGPLASLGDLKRIRGIGYIPEQIYDEELNYLPQIREDLKPHLTSSSINVQLGLTLAARGVCVLPAFMARHHPELIRILAREVDIVRSFWIVTPEDLGRIEKIRAVAEHVALRVREAIGAAQAGAEAA